MTRYYRLPPPELQYIAPPDFRFIREHIEWACRNFGSTTWPPQSSGYTGVPAGVQQSPPPAMANANWLLTCAEIDSRFKLCGRDGEIARKFHVEGRSYHSLAARYRLHPVAVEEAIDSVMNYIGWGGHFADEAKGKTTPRGSYECWKVKVQGIKCPHCHGTALKLFGHNRNSSQVLWCKGCRRRFTPGHHETSNAEQCT